MIKISPVFFDGNIIEEPDLSYKSHDTPLHKIAMHIIEKLNNFSDFTKPEFQNFQKYLTEDISIDPPQNKDFNIDLIFVDNYEIFDYWSVPPDSLGFHCITAGVYDSLDNSDLSTSHRVVVNLNDNLLKKLILEERLEEMDPFNDRHDSEILFSFLNTITHELIHCKEFIEHGNGLTPDEIQNNYEAGFLDLNLLDISTGNGTLFPFLDEENNVSDQDLIDVMEERVESKGRFLLNSLSIDYNLILDALKEYSPTEEEINKELNPSSSLKMF